MIDSEERQLKMLTPASIGETDDLVANARLQEEIVEKVKDEEKLIESQFLTEFSKANAGMWYKIEGVDVSYSELDRIRLKHNLRMDIVRDTHDNVRKTFIWKI